MDKFEDKEDLLQSLEDDIQCFSQGFASFDVSPFIIGTTYQHSSPDMGDSVILN
jgi:hypothetical protein